MIGLLQRVSHAEVSVKNAPVAAIGPGLMVLVGIKQHDTDASARRLLERLLGYRVFPDEQGRMNRSLRQIAGGLLLVPQFTLAAETRKGARPSFASAAEPEEAARLFEVLVATAKVAHHDVAAGEFGADMAVSLTNNGPVTFWLETPV